MLEDELRAARTELQSEGNSSKEIAEHEAALEAEFEAKVRTIREEFQQQIASIESTYKDQVGQHDVELADRLVAAEQGSRSAVTELEGLKAQLSAAKEEAANAKDRLVRQAEQHAATAKEFEAMKAGLASRQERFDRAGDQVKRAEAAAADLVKTLEKTKTELATSREQSKAQHARADELSTELAQAGEEAKQATARAGELAAQLDAAAQSNVDLNRRMQEMEARRALEIAGTEGRADLDEILRVTQERLAGQTEKLIRAEKRVTELEREFTAITQRNEEIEAQLRQRQMSGAIKQIRGDAEPQDSVVAVEGQATEAKAPSEPRTASPFIAELSLDAKKALTRILGVTQVLKHKKDAKDQAQLIKQLTAYARRLDHTVSDLVDAEQLAVGTVNLSVKRTDLKALAARVVEESGVGAEHEIKVESESVIVGVDQRRTEQILAGLLRTSSDRTPAGKSITVKLTRVDGGALLFVEDPEPAKNATPSPVVQRFAEVQGGWARVEPLDNGGTSFRVFLPDGGPDSAKGAPAPSAEELERELQILDEQWDPDAEKLLVDELHRLSADD
jgi:signal transduction histidine kinase